MPAAKKPKNEKARLASLHALNVLDTHEEKEFTAVVEAASLVCDVPMSFISLVDTDRQWFKASVGLPGVKETPREMAFCAHAIHQDGVFEVSDATQDPRFSDNQLVLDDPNIRFYAATTLKLSNGAHVGTLCVIDNMPHELTEKQQLILKQLGVVASNLLEQRDAREKANQLIAEQSVMTNMLNQSHDAIISLSTGGLVTHWNKGAEMLFGYTFEEMLGESLDKLLPESRESSQTTAVLLKELDHGLEYDATRVCKSGKELIVSISLSPYFSENGELIAITKIVRDITARVKHEAEIAAQRQLTSAMIEGQSVATFMIDAEHRVVQWNKACEALTGKSATEMIGKADAWRGFYDSPRPVLADLVLDDLRHDAKNYYDKEGESTLTENGWHAEAWFDRLGGKRRYAIFDATPIRDADGNVIGALETLQDITQQKNIEQAFEDKQQSFNSVLEGTEAGIWHWNNDINEYHFSEIWAEKLGYANDECIPLSTEAFMQLIHADDKKAMMAKLKAHLAGKVDFYESEFRMAHRDGHWVWVLARGRLIISQTYKSTGWVHGTYTDITSRKLLELDLKQAYHNLDEFTAVASHDLKSPLRGIADLIDWINEDLGDEVQESVRNNLNRVQLRVKRLETLINDLLQYSRSCETSEVVHLVDPNNMVNEVIDILNMPKTFTVQVNCDVKPFNTYLVPLQTILRKALSNAVKHHDRDDGEVAVNIYAQQEFVVFEVQDDGPGIPETAHERVFKLFQSLSKAQGSSGMGLAVSKRLAEVHGGRIELESDLNKGTLIRLYWPKKSARIA